MWKRWLLIGLVAWGGYTQWSKRAVEHGPGVVAPKAPLQTNFSDSTPFEFKGYRITRLAEYDVDARVLSREDYRMGREAELSPTDFGIGWGRMSDEEVLKNIEISQSGRFMHWRVQEFPIPQREIETSAANMHLIPSDAAVERQIAAVRKGQVVHMRGYLVRADASDGWHWVSSLSRDDAGAGACELFWVENVSVL